MKAKRFLILGGLIFIILGIFGMVKVLGPEPEYSAFGRFWWGDSAENWTRIIAGTTAILAALVLSDNVSRKLAKILGALAIAAAGYNVFADRIGSVSLERPADLIFNLAIGIWAFASVGAPRAVSETTPARRSANNAAAGQVKKENKTEPKPAGKADEETSPRGMPPVI